MKTAHDLVALAKNHIQEIDINTADTRIAQADILIDVREPEEYRQGHIPGAINMPRGLLEFQISGQPALQSRDIAIVLYCKTSGRAALAARSLQEMGYLNISSIYGGFDAWAAANKPITKPSLPNFD